MFEAVHALLVSTGIALVIAVFDQFLRWLCRD